MGGVACLKSSSITTPAGRLIGAFFRSRSLPSGFIPSRVLVIKLCCLGDVLMATPSLRLLRRAFPHAQIDLAIGSWSRPAIFNNPNLDEIIDTGQLGGGYYPWADYLRLAWRLRRRRYDLAIVLERSVFATLLPALAGIPYRAGLDSEGRGFPLTVRVPCSPQRHEADLYLDVAEAALKTMRVPKSDDLAIEARGQRLEFYPTEEDKATVAGRFADKRRPLVAIHPGGAVNPGSVLLSKRWPSERFAAIADRLIECLGASVLLLGGVTDVEAVEAVRRQMRHPALILDPGLSFGQLGAAIACCDLYIGNDSGPAHLAAAVGTPVVVVFGPTDPRVYGPYGGAGEAVWSGHACAPCFSRGRSAKCKQPECLREVSVDMAWSAIERRLAASREARL